MCKKITLHYIMWVKITLHSNIVKLKPKNENNNFKVDVKFTKLKMKIKKAQQTNCKKAILNTLQFTVSAIIHTHLLVGLKFYIFYVIHSPTTNILQIGANFKWSLRSLAENRKEKLHALLTAKWKYFHGFFLHLQMENIPVKYKLCI